ncbi:MAG: Maf-like protein [Flavobacteriaceae bacterium]|nr:Maf-like protein [Flavobacteriaceae bacterium]
MIESILKNKKLVLASGSPRRQQFLKDLQLPFRIQVKEIDEVYPAHLEGAAISDYLAVLKAKAFENELKKEEILITSDTIVWHQNKALGKPKSYQEAFDMLKSLSNTSHEVISSICLSSNKHQEVVHHTTKVWFKSLSDREINYYISQYEPYDKAGAYGIQEWIGLIGVIRIEGSYFNVMGMPTQLLIEELTKFVAKN